MQMNGIVYTAVETMHALCGVYRGLSRVRTSERAEGEGGGGVCFNLGTERGNNAA